VVVVAHYPLAGLLLYKNGWLRFWNKMQGDE
jgi:hypothetical protein